MEMGYYFWRDYKESFKECAVPNWDGYGALPLDGLSVVYVGQFLEQLPPDISKPEVVPEPTGCLTMVWRKNGYHLVVGINADGNLAWGGTTPTGGTHGDAKFKGGIPASLMDLLGAIDSVRAAHKGLV